MRTHLSIYLLMKRYKHEGSTVLGVFTSQEKAEFYQAKLQATLDPNSYWESYEVAEWQAGDLHDIQWRIDLAAKKALEKEEPS